MEKVEESASNVEEEVGEVMEQERELQESGASLLWRLSNEEQSILQRANSLESTIRRLRSLITSLLSQKLLDPKLSNKVKKTPYIACTFLLLFHLLIKLIKIWIWNNLKRI